MAKKNKLDDPDSLDDFGLDFDDMDIFNPEMKDDRTPAKKIMSGIGQAFDPRKNAVHMAKSVGFKMLPKAYENAFNEVTSIKDDIGSIYYSTAREFDPVLRQLKTVAKATIGKGGKFLPKKLVDRVNKLDDSEESSSYSSSNYDANTSQINASLEAVFGAQKQHAEYQDKKDTVHKQYSDKLGRKQFEYTSGIQATMANSLSRLVGYQDTVLDQYYRKSLELQHRQFFATRDLLDLQKATAQSTLQHLADIQKNTALPDAVKITKDEQFKNLTQQRIIGAIQDSARGKLGGLTRKLREGIERESGNFARSFMSGKDQLKQFTGGEEDSSFNMGDEFDPQVMMGRELLGNGIIETYGGKLGLKLKGKMPGWVNKIHPDASNQIDATGSRLDRWLSDYPAWMNRKMRDSNGEGLWGMLSGLTGGPTSQFDERINKNLFKDAVEPVAWDIISRRTLIDVIPGYLSRHLEKMTDIYDVLTGNQNKSDRIIYSAKHEKFITQKQAINDVAKETRNKFSSGIYSSANDILDSIDDGSLTKTDRALMAVKLAQDAAENVEFDPSYYANSFNLPNGVSENVAQLFRKKYNITQSGTYGEKYNIGNDKDTQELHTKMSQRFNDLRGGMGDFNDILNSHYAVGNTEVLNKLGLVNDRGYVDQDYRWNLIKEMMSYDNPNDFYKAKIGESGESLGSGSLNFRMGSPTSSTGNSTFDSGVFEPLTNSLDRLTMGLMPLMTKVSAALDRPEETRGIDLDPLTRLVSQQEEHSTRQAEYLDRIAHAVENIQNVSLSDVVSGGDPQVKTSFLRKIFRLPGAYLKANVKLYQKMAPFRRMLYSTAMNGIGLMGKGIMPMGRMAWGGAKGLAGLFGRSVQSGFNRLPGQLQFMGSLLGPLLSGGMNLGGKALGLGKKGLGFGWDILQGIPGALGRDGKIMKSLIGHGATAGSFLSKGATSVFDKLAGWGLNKDNVKEKTTGFFSGIKERYDSFDLKGKLSDIYVQGQSLHPVLTVKGMMNREYYDQVSGKVIEKYEDIKGVVVDKTGNVVLSASDFFTGLVDKGGKPYKEHLSEAYANLSKYLPDRLPDIKGGIGKLFGKLNTIQDVYVFGDSMPRMFADKIAAGHYIDLKTGKVIKSINQIRGDVWDKTLNRFVISKTDIQIGLVDWKGKAIKTMGKISTAAASVANIGKGIFGKVKDGIGNPFGILGTALSKSFEVLSHKDSDMLKVLNNIYGHMKSAFPVQDAETREANRVGGVSDILRRRAEARLNKGKKAGAATAAGVAAGAASGIGQTPGGDKPKEPEGGQGLIDKGLDFIGDNVGTAIAGGYAAFKAGKWAMPAANAAKGVGARGVVGRFGIPGMLVAAASYAHDKIMDYSVNAVHGAIHRRKDMQPLEQIRFMQYGVPMDNKEAVKTMQNFEADMMSYITVSMTDKPKIDKKVDEIWSKYCGDFGYPESNKAGFTKFAHWFQYRFVPVFIKHTVVADGYGLKLYDLDTRAGIHDKLKIVNAVQFNDLDAKAGLTPLKISTSPWAEISLADNTLAIEGLSDQIREASKAGVNAKKENLKPVKPKADKDKEKEKASVPETAEQAAKEKMRRELDNEQKKGFLSRAMDSVMDWSKVNLLPTAKRVFDSAKNAVGDVASGFISAVGSTSAGKWLNTNVITPAKNTLSAIIQGGESGKASYNAYNRGTVGGRILGPVGPRQLTKMTIAEILADMARPISDERRLFAVGKYQMIPGTLKDAVRALKIDPSTTLFDEATQERLFSGYLMDIKRRAISKYIKGNGNDLKGAVNAAASEWASIADPDTGRSKYGHGNAASISAEVVAGAMTKSREMYKMFLAKGFSEEEAYQRALATDPSTTATEEEVKGTNEPTTLASASPTTEPPKMPAGGPLADFGKTNAGNQLPSARNPWAAEAPVDKTDDMLASTSTETSSASAPDLSHISKATLSVGEQAQAQRDKQLTEQQRTNLLLEQLVKANAGGQGNQQGPVQQASVSGPQKPVNLKPVVNLERSTS